MCTLHVCEEQSHFWEQLPAPGVAECTSITETKALLLLKGLGPG